MSEKDLQLILDNIIIWDFEGFLLVLKNENPVFKEDEVIPNKLDDDHFLFGYIKFKASSTIHSECIVEDIVKAYAHFEEQFPLLLGNLYSVLNGRLVDEFTSYFNLNKLTSFMTSEPNILEIIRICYWYYKCDLLSSTFCHKKMEIRRKIKGLLDLDLFRPYYQSVSYDKFSSDYEFNCWIKERISELSPARKKEIVTRSHED
jgi:hypothetical protein